VVHVADREADIFDFMHYIASKQEHFVIRACQNRYTVNGQRVLSSLDEKEFCAEVNYTVPSKGGRPKRDVTLGVKYDKLTLSVPERPESSFAFSVAPIDVWYIEVTELNPIEGEEPINWRLLTNVAVKNPQEAIERIHWYQKRWAIEELHKILKSGCRIEKAQFQTVKRLSNNIALSSFVAWRIYYLVHINPVQPDAPASSVLTKSEIEALELLLNSERKRTGKQRRLRIKTAGQAINQIACLGGYLDRKNDPYPGITVMWRGMHSLAVATLTWLAAQQATYV
jgi:hypothetical protein